MSVDLHISLLLIYRTRAVINCSLYTFYPLFEVHLCTVTFGHMYGQYSRVVSNQERIIVARVRQSSFLYFARVSTNDRQRIQNTHQPISKQTDVGIYWEYISEWETSTFFLRLQTSSEEYQLGAKFFFQYSNNEKIIVRLLGYKLHTYLHPYLREKKFPSILSFTNIFV